MPRSKEQDRQSRRIYHLTHAIMRMKQRYALTMDAQDYDAFGVMFQSGGVKGAKADDKGFIEGWIKFKDTWVCMSYSPGLKMVTTIMPAPPPFVVKEESEKAISTAVKLAVKKAKESFHSPALVSDEREFNKLVASQAKSMAYGLFEQAMLSRSQPKWLQLEILKGDPEAVKLTTQRTAERRLDAAAATQLGMDPEVRKADVAWFKRRLNDVNVLLRDGKLLDAMCLLNGVLSLERTFHPSQELEAANALVHSRSHSERPHILKFLTLKGYPQTLGRPQEPGTSETSQTESP